MKKENNTGNTKAERGGDTSRSSSQGRKIASGKRTGTRGNPEMDEATHREKSEQGKEKRIGERRKA